MFGILFLYNTLNMSPAQFILHAPTCLWRWNRQSVPKRRHIKFRRRGITQKKAYNIGDNAKVWNEGFFVFFKCAADLLFTSPISRILTARGEGLEFDIRQNGTTAGFYSGTSVFPCQYHPSNAPHTFIHVLSTLCTLSKSQRLKKKQIPFFLIIHFFFVIERKFFRKMAALSSSNAGRFMAGDPLTLRLPD